MKTKLFLVAAIFAGSLFFGQVASAQKFKPATEHWIDRSVDISISNRGFGFGGTWDYAWNREWQSPVQLNTLFFREPNKIPYYDPYTGIYYDPASKKIVFLSGRTGIKRRLWTESLAENTRPFFVLSGGPTLALDPSNYGSFFKRWQKTKLSVTAHALIGAGVEFIYSRRSQFTATVGYEIMNFPNKVDGSYNYSGIIITLSLGERL